MPTSTLSISLPDPMREFVEQEIVEQGYSDVSDYFHELVEERQRRKEERILEERLLASANSGDPIEINAEFWERLKTRFAERHGRELGSTNK